MPRFESGNISIQHQPARGWAKGTKEFKKAVLEDLKDPDAKRIVESEAAEVWIAENLHMGTPSYVQSLVGRHRIGGGCKHWETLKKP